MSVSNVPLHTSPKCPPQLVEQFQVFRFQFLVARSVHLMLDNRYIVIKR